jgi:LysM repeat protein
VLCFLAGRFLPIPGIPGFPGEPTASPAVDTPTLVPPTDVAEQPTPTEEGQVPGPEEPTPTEEGQVPGPEEPTPTEEGQVPGPEEPTATEEPGEEPPTTEPTATEEPGEEPPSTEPTATTVPVPGPTSTPTPGESDQANCDANIPPVADAGDTYEAMMGKGQAVVNFDGSGSLDPDGTIESYEWDFGDNSASVSGQTVSHAYGSTGSYVARLTVTDNCGATSEDTADVTIVGPTPPANGTTTPVPATPPLSNSNPPAGVTLGFCHLVQRGQTLSGIAAAYGVPWPTLAEVNGVGLGYFVIAGQGLFIPTSQVQYGPNVYEVQPGDTLGSVASQCGLTANILATVNNLSPGAGLSPGQFLVIPPWRQVHP